MSFQVLSQGESKPKAMPPLELHSGSRLAGWLLDRKQVSPTWRRVLRGMEKENVDAAADAVAGDAMSLLAHAVTLSRESRLADEVLQGVQPQLSGQQQPQQGAAADTDDASAASAELARLCLDALVRLGCGPSSTYTPSATVSTQPPEISGSNASRMTDLASPVVPSVLGASIIADALPVLLPETLGKKTLLRAWADKRTAAWIAARDALEKEGAHLGHAAEMLNGLVQYDVAALKRARDQAAATLRESARKRTDSEKAAASARAKYARDCEHLGVAGIDIRQELETLAAKELPELLRQIVELAQDPRVDAAMTYYGSFIRYTSENESTATTVADGQQLVHERLPALLRVRTEGASLVPASLADPASSGVIESLGAGEASDAAAGEIDWSALMNVQNDVSASGANTAEVAIDWSALGTSGGDQISSAPIEWDVAAIGEGGADAEWEIEVDDVGVQADSANGAGASELETPELRADLLRDIRELFGFCSQRQAEHAEQSDSSSRSRGKRSTGGSQLLNAIMANSIPAPPAGASESDMVEVLKQLIDILEGSRLLTLLSAKNSPSFLDRTARELEKSLDVARRHDEFIQTSEAREPSLRQTIDETGPALEETKNRVRLVKAALERALSKLYEGRTVRIIGEINAILRE